jgi:hypothetical protein
LGQGAKIAFSPSLLPVDAESGTLEIAIPLQDDGAAKAPCIFKIVMKLTAELNTARAVLAEEGPYVGELPHVHRGFERSAFAPWRFICLTRG